ncbi:MAG: hypothetical protein K6G55_00435 [Selenomonadaceae bacterium]|nr:hypothetical protein [Selenomonadaceae bacterium]
MTTKKFLSLILTGALALTLSAPVQAEKLQTIEDSGISSKEKSRLINDYYNSLPKAKGEYKSRVRPIIVEGAMNTETEKLVRALKNPVVYRDLNYLFISGTYKNYPVVIVRTEQGMSNSAASTALAIKKFNPVAVINQGTSGGYKES